jgi:hypothetical protein
VRNSGRRYEPAILVPPDEVTLLLMGFPVGA